MQKMHCMYAGRRFISVFLLLSSAPISDATCTPGHFQYSCYPIENWGAPESKVAKAARQAATKKAKAEAKRRRAEAEEAKAAEQTQVEVAGSSGRGTETGEVHVYTGRARRASRRATGVG